MCDSHDGCKRLNQSVEPPVSHVIQSRDNDDWTQILDVKNVLPFDLFTQILDLHEAVGCDSQFHEPGFHLINNFLLATWHSNIDGDLVLGNFD